MIWDRNDVITVSALGDNSITAPPALAPFGSATLGKTVWKSQKSRDTEPLWEWWPSNSTFAFNTVLVQVGEKYTFELKIILAAKKF